MGVRGIRGATTIKEDTSIEILEATQELMEELINQNVFLPEHVAAVFITVTTDIAADFPAKAIRKIPGWELVPLMCSTEIPVPESLPKCIRIMMLVNTDLNPDEVKHVFLRDAVKLRPDLAQKNALTS
ncbi:chorismate mutase [Ammoniphilus sp. CFH 90114]|uniref:chorismate mutase n=1 Tax=Ammoniphilus sp. CFH 90114 TaxID=2493665 RepID=UPI00100EB942|nr:chorismate mutase [Ammoniphilus sp. CFH 90114]RXT13911.1 chorismate mutase [Ammoniphilus sp. CFH 90114]